ncbi:hypothetical protein G7054_g6011 [Neopestalotiopsis clavispora]|nr:hypothetical protein G7054_g6011 [Neopestalotiopsis clavispora]
MATISPVLGQHSLCADDSVLLTLFLFTLFEMIVPEYGPVNLQCNVHLLGGTMSLLRWRSDRGVSSQLDESVMAFTHHICLISFFINHDGWNSKLVELDKLTSSLTSPASLDPAIARAVKFKRQVRAHTDATALVHLPVDGRELVVANGIGIVKDLQSAATDASRSTYGLDSSSIQRSRAFNQLYGTSTKTTESIVTCLYWSLGYHIIELIASVSDSMTKDCDGLDSTSIDQLLSFANYRSLEEVCNELDGIADLGMEHDVAKDNVGIGCRAFGTFWPLAILLFSSSITKERRAWLREKLRVIGATSGFGLATWTANVPARMFD